MYTLERVPWSSKEEWECCRDNLFGENLPLKRKALEHLYIWKVRCANLPVAVECTLTLMEVHLRACSETEEDEIVTNTLNYESWYSVAIIRFLNLITDSSVGDQPSSSMNEVARQYGIPEGIVNLRHAISHGPSLPSLDSLKEAAETCLNWLYESYWSKNIYQNTISTQNENNSSSTFLCFEVCLFLKKYLSFGFENVLDVPPSDRDKIDRVLSKNNKNQETPFLRERPLAEIYKCVLKKLERHLKKNTEYGKNLISSILDSDDYLLSHDAVVNNELCATFFDFWSDIVFVIRDSSVCYHFLLQLISIVNSPLENHRRQYCAALYLNEILKSIRICQKTNLCVENSENKLVKRRKLTKKLDSSNQLSHSSLSDTKLTEEEISNLIQTALNEPNENVKIFLKNLLGFSNSSKHLAKYEKFVTLIDIFIGNRLDVTDHVSVDDTSYTIEKLIGKSFSSAVQISEKVEDDTSTKTVEVSKDNSIDESADWKNTPLGLLPWQVNFQPWIDIYDLEE